jgi:hypothetical protein
MITQNTLTFGNLAELSYSTNLSLGDELYGDFIVTSTASNPATGFKALSAYNDKSNTLAIGFAGTDTANKRLVRDFTRRYFGLNPTHP